MSPNHAPAEPYLAVVAQVMAGHVLFSREVIEAAAKPKDNDHNLTPRELEVLQQADTGLEYKAIGVVLGISQKTVNNHMQNIFSKLGVRNRQEAVNEARKRSWLK